MAKCWTQYLPSPKMKWQIYVSLISEKGKTLGRATQLCENSGESTSVGSNVSIRRTDELEFTPTGEPIELKQAKRFFVKLEGASISEASSPPQKEQTNKPEEMVQHHDPAVVPVSTSPRAGRHTVNRCRQACFGTACCGTTHRLLGRQDPCRLAGAGYKWRYGRA